MISNFTLIDCIQWRCLDFGYSGISIEKATQIANETMQFFPNKHPYMQAYIDARLRQNGIFRREIS